MPEPPSWCIESVIRWQRGSSCFASDRESPRGCRATITLTTEVHRVRSSEKALEYSAFLDQDSRAQNLRAAIVVGNSLSCILNRPALKIRPHSRNCGCAITRVHVLNPLGRPRLVAEHFHLRWTVCFCLLKFCFVQGFFWYLIAPYIRK